MVPGDDRAAAVVEARRLSDRRARSFWDPERFVGRTLSVRFGREQADAFREAVGDARPEALEAIDSFFGPFESVHPAWDCALFYPRGARWTDAFPPPVAFSMQLRFVESEREGEEPSGVFWTRRQPRELVESSWPLELFAGIHAVME